MQFRDEEARRHYNSGMSDWSEHVARSFVAAINRHDLDDLAALMTPDHRFIDSLGNVVEGREKMRTGWVAYFKMVPDYRITIDECICRDPVVVLFGVAEGTLAVESELKRENRWSTPIALRATLAGGLVAEWRVYADNEPIRALMRKG
jgi:ketosteroid isomerase-like protein